MEVLVSHLNEAPARPSALAAAVPAELDDVVLRALAKDPAIRPTTAGELAAGARAVLEQLSSSTEARTYDALTVPARPPGPARVGVGRPVVGTPPGPRPVPGGVPSPPRPDGRPPWTNPPGGGAPPAAIPPPRAGSGPVAPPPPASAAGSGRLGIVALVLAVLVAPVGLVLGVVAHRRGDRRGTVAIVLGAVLTVAAVAGGYYALRTPVVSASAVAGQIVAQSGLAPGQVTCPDALPARVGASVVCTARGGGGTQSLRATVTSVNGDQVRFDIVAQ
jgi:hypothetical protein